MMNVNGSRRSYSHEDRYYEPRSQDYERPYEPMSRRGGEDLRGRSETPIVKVIEVLAQSPHSWEDAARRAVGEASRTVRDIRSIYIKEMQAIVEDDHIVAFRINAKVSFALHPGSHRPR